MPRFCQLSGCCVAPLLLCGVGARQVDDDDELSRDDQLEHGHINKTPGSALVDKVSVRLCGWWRRRRPVVLRLMQPQREALLCVRSWQNRVPVQSVFSVG